MYVQCVCVCVCVCLCVCVCVCVLVATSTSALSCSSSSCGSLYYYLYYYSFTTWRCDQHVRALSQLQQLRLDGRAAMQRAHAHTPTRKPTSTLSHHVRGLQGEFARGCKHLPCNGSKAVSSSKE